jgi:hypothetical protein
LGSHHQPTGYWYKDAIIHSGNYRPIQLFLGPDNQANTMQDHITEGTLFPGEVNYIQYFYASDFNPPSWLIMPSGWSLDGVASGAELKVPLLIKDLWNQCKGPGYLAGQPVRLTKTSVGIDNDMGPGTGCAPGH